MNQQYAELAELAGGFIHEIKNHLSTLGLNLQLLGEDFEQPQSPRERRALERILRLQKECQRLVDVSNEFLRFARFKELVTEPCNLREVVDEIVDFFDPMARATNIHIKSYLPSNLPTVALDRDLFKQALLNLLLNAQHAMPDGGELTIQANLLSEAPPNNSPTETSAGAPIDPKAVNGECIQLSLIDTGKGMSPEVLAKAFRPFYSTREGGSGLGLPTTRKIIDAHGGRIEVQSAVGRGTKFTILLPTLPTVDSSTSEV